MNYVQDGYYSDAEKLAASIERWHREGWALVAVIPPGLTNSHGQPQGASAVWAHPTDEAPPWEQ